MDLIKNIAAFCMNVFVGSWMMAVVVYFFFNDVLEVP